MILRNLFRAFSITFILENCKNVPKFRQLGNKLDMQNDECTSNVEVVFSGTSREKCPVYRIQERPV